MSGYIGTQPVPQATQTRDVFTATSGQTTFATSGYTPNFLDVYLNGVKLVNGDDFTATNGSDVVLTTGAAAGDTVEVLSYSTFEVNSQTFTGTTTLTGDLQATTATFSGAVTGTSATLSGGVYLGGTGAANLLDDYEEGSFTAYLNDTVGNTSSTSFTGSYVKVGQIVSVCVYLTNIDVTGMEGTSSVSMTLPFTANNSVSNANYWVGNTILDRVSLGSYVSVVPRTSGASSSLSFRLTGDNLADAAFPWSYLNATNVSDIFVSITYQTT